VDDTAVVRELERSILEGAGYRVRTAADGRQALAALADAPADLVVTDVDMPGGDGLQLTRSIRAEAAWAGLPVVVVTSKSADADRRRALEAGADAYLGKGDLDQRTLLAVVGRLLGRPAAAAGEVPA
jgi:two-component system, chemotaxis family, sensor kinase CheA